MSKMSREKSRNTAAYLKLMGVERTTGQCPWGCGKSIPNGGDPLLAHLNRCRGRNRAEIYQRTSRVPRRSRA